MRLFRIVFVWICVAALLIGHGLYKYNTGGIWYGMASDEVKQIVPDSGALEGYYYFLNNAGNIVMFRYGHERIDDVGRFWVNNIRVIDASFCNPSHLRFMLLRFVPKGILRPDQIIPFVGIPIRIPAGFVRAGFLSNDSRYYYRLSFRTSKILRYERRLEVVDGPLEVYPDLEITRHNKAFPFLVPRLHNMLDGAIVWAAILYTAKLRNQQKKKTAEAE